MFPHSLIFIKHLFNIIESNNWHNIADLRKIKKKVRKNLGVQTEESERPLQRQRLQMLTRHIEEEKLEQNTQKLVKTVESLQKAPGIISENTFWKFQQQKTTKRAEDSNEE